MSNETTITLEALLGGCKHLERREGFLKQRYRIRVSLKAPHLFTTTGIEKNVKNNGSDEQARPLAKHLTYRYDCQKIYFNNFWHPKFARTDFRDCNCPSGTSIKKDLTK
jgi:hypothetical protein